MKLLNKNGLNALDCFLTGQCQIYRGWRKTAKYYKLHILRKLHAFPWDISSKLFYLNIIYVGSKFNIVSVAEGFTLHVSGPACDLCWGIQGRFSRVIWMWLENLLAFHIMKQIISFQPWGKKNRRVHDSFCLCAEPRGDTTDWLKLQDPGFRAWI